MIRHLTLIVLTASLVLCAPASPAGGLKPAGLKCEYRANPLGLDAPRPRLSWQLESKERGQSQTAYQVLAATSRDALAKGSGDLWDSGKVVSSGSGQVAYGGPPLRSGQRVYWQVRAWDREGNPSAYSAPAWWEVGLLAPADWQAAWITRQQTPPRSEAQMFEDDPAPLLRKET
ncbi:MAG: hypothetical protein NTX51_04015 [Verrucomicrobia bacterium]|nr:hypothetical protein [Verrucomicrobiota bacterium]